MLTTGLIFHLGLMTFTGGFQPIESDAIWLSIVAGVLFVIATFGLYAAFQRGPVRVVAPLIAGYPILSVAWAVWMGTEISALQWLAVRKSYLHNHNVKWTVYKLVGGNSSMQQRELTPGHVSSFVIAQAIFAW